MQTIHPTAIVSSSAKLGNDVRVAPYAVIYDDVEIGDGSYIGPHTVIYDGARIGNRVKIYQGASISHVPQDLKFGNEKTYLHIGDDTVIHENATLHRGTKETGKTVIGSNALLMAYSHVAHDCRVGDRVILANAVQIAGHVHIGDWTIVGGVTAVHQFTHIGQHSMIGGGLRGIGQDVPPYIIVASEPVKFAGLNVIGLRRRGFTNEQITVLKGIYDILYDKKYNVSQAKEKIREDYRDDPYAVEIIGFIENSKRGISGK